MKELRLAGPEGQGMTGGEQVTKDNKAMFNKIQIELSMYLMLL